MHFFATHQTDSRSTSIPRRDGLKRRYAPLMKHDDIPVPTNNCPYAHECWTIAGNNRYRRGVCQLINQVINQDIPRSLRVCLFEFEAQGGKVDWAAFDAKVAADSAFQAEPVHGRASSSANANANVLHNPSAHAMCGHYFNASLQEKVMHTNPFLAATYIHAVKSYVQRAASIRGGGAAATEGSIATNKPLTCCAPISLKVS